MAPKGVREPLIRWSIWIPETGHSVRFFTLDAALIERHSCVWFHDDYSLGKRIKMSKQGGELSQEKT